VFFIQVREPEKGWGSSYVACERNSKVDMDLGIRKGLSEVKVTLWTESDPPQKKYIFKEGEEEELLVAVSLRVCLEKKQEIQGREGKAEVTSMQWI
jgi:hypothetical protein